MSDTVEDLKARLERAEKRLAAYEALFLCKRCGTIGHDMETCMQESMPDAIEVDPNDVFIHSKVDRRIIDHLATEMWQLALSYLPVRDVVPHVPRVCKYLGREVVWGKYSGRLMWAEMAPGAEGIDARVFKTHNETALIRACYRGAPGVHVATLLAGGAHASTALCWASWRGREDVVRVLLGANADPNVVTTCNIWTPLLQASYNGNLAVVTLLIAAGANVNHVNNGGRTALMMACNWNHIDCARLLIDAGADHRVRDNQGRTALDRAHGNMYDDVVRLLESL